MEQAVIVAGGMPDASDATQLAAADYVIAADAGAAWLDANGRRPDLLIGDLDSIDPGLLARLEASGVPIERHPVDKDATDLELALDAVVEAGARRVTVIGALAGERLDHELANLLLLTDRGLASQLADLRMVRGGTLVRALHGPGSLEVESGAGATVSLLPFGSEASGIVTSGLAYPLDGETLTTGRSRGVSNVVNAASASVSLDAGVLLVVEIRKE